MFKKWKKKYYQKAILAALEKRDMSGLNAKMETLAFLYDGDVIKDLSSFKTIANTLDISEAQTKYFSFVTFQKKAPSLTQEQFCERDISFKGVITGVSAKQFVQTQTDVLVYMSNKDHQYLDVVAAKSVARFKVGFEGADPRFFDLILAVDPNDTALVSAELTKYFKILGKISA